MDNQRIAELIKMLEVSQLSVLEYQEMTPEGGRLRLERYPFPGMGSAAAYGVIGAADRPATVHAPAPASEDAPPVEAREEPAKPDTGEPLTGADIIAVTAPMVGVFHSLANPLAMGDRVQKGAPVCIVEAMKLMNEITAEEPGEIAWIAARDGDMVEYGQLLMQIRRIGA